MKKLKSLRLILPLLAVALSAHVMFAQSSQPQTNSAGNSPSSDTSASRQPAERVNSPRIRTGASQGLINSCMAAVDDLKAHRELADALTSENDALRTRLETEKRTTAMLTELNETRKSETDALRETVAAKNEAIAAKDAVIASQDKLIETLKKKKSSPWKRSGDVLIGAALIAVLK